MSEVAELHRLRDSVVSRLRDGDVTGAWEALQNLADAAQRPEVPLEEVQRCLAECLEVIGTWSKTVGDATSPLTEADTSGLASAASCAVAASAFVLLAWPLVRPSLIADILERHRPRLESVARQQLADPAGAPGVIQDAAVRILSERQEPSAVEEVVAEVYRQVRDRARTRGRQQLARARRLTPLDDVRHLLGHNTPDLEVAVSLRELDELAAQLLSPELRSVYLLRRDDVPPTKIAEHLGITPRTALRRWQEIRRRLGRTLAPPGDSEPS